jgi:hypothetical protein
MFEYISQNKFKVEHIGKEVTVANNDYAKLMYYLSCIDSVINYGKMNMLIDYENYHLLSATQKEIILNLCKKLNPRIFIDAGIFIVDEKLLPDNYSNRFYKITDLKVGIKLNQEIVIGGKSVKILKIMVCNSNWIKNNYITPIKNILGIKLLSGFIADALLNSAKNASNNKSSNKDEDPCLIW